MNFAIYSRKSKLSDKGSSIENQIKMCSDYIYSHFENVNPDNIYIYEDEGFSGKNTNRPMFNDLMLDISQGKINCIVCYRLDRISRNINDFSTLMTMLEQKNISFVSIKEQFDTSTPMGRAMMYITSVFSQLERETIAERIKDNLYLLASKGNWLGGITPYGFNSKKVLDNTKSKIKHFYTLEENKDEIIIAKKIFDIFLKTNKISEVEKFLKNNKILGRNGNCFSRYYIRSILKNPVYAKADKATYTYFFNKNSIITSPKEMFNGSKGTMAYNKRSSSKNKTNSENQWIITIGSHEGLISGSLWVKVQNILEDNKYSSSKYKIQCNLFKNKIYCGKCGSLMYPKKRNNTIYYICNNKNKNGVKCCNQKNISHNLVIKQVFLITKTEDTLKETKTITPTKNDDLIFKEYSNNIKKIICYDDVINIY